MGGLVEPFPSVHKDEKRAVKCSKWTLINYLKSTLSHGNNQVINQILYILSCFMTFSLFSLKNGIYIIYFSYLFLQNISSEGISSKIIYGHLFKTAMSIILVILQRITVIVVWIYSLIKSLSHADLFNRSSRKKWFVIHLDSWYSACLMENWI